MILRSLKTGGSERVTLILENGEITEMGTHRELIEKKGYYYNVYKLQGGGEIDG